MFHIIGIKGRYLMRYPFPIYLIGRESKIRMHQFSQPIKMLTRKAGTGLTLVFHVS